MELDKFTHLAVRVHVMAVVQAAEQRKGRREDAALLGRSAVTASTLLLYELPSVKFLPVQ